MSQASRALGSVHPTELVDARLQLHWATQLVAAFGNTVLRARDDQSHTTLSWSAVEQALVTEPCDDVQAALYPAELELAVLRNGNASERLALGGQRFEDGRLWLSAQASKALERALALKGADPEQPEHGVGSGAAFDANQEALSELARWFDVAHAVLSEPLHVDSDAEPVRCWPHHFDIARLLVLARAKGGEVINSVGIGMTPGDAGIGEPYFYVTPWPYPEKEALQPLPSDGEWNVEGWIGAVLLGSKVLGLSDAGAQHDAVAAFVKEAMTQCLSLLDPEKARPRLKWVRALGPADLLEGRVQTVTCEHQTLCLTHFEGRYAALDNKCPHQGGPLGEGSIEGGMLRCPWHGWDFHPLTGKPPGGYDDGVATHPVEQREDGIYVGLEPETQRERTVSDVMAETMVGWGVRWVFGMVGHSNLGLAGALRVQEQAGKLRYVGIRHEGAASFACSAYGKLTGRAAACLSIAGPGATNLLTGLWDANVDRAPVLALTGQVDTQVLGPGAFQEIDQTAAFGKVSIWSQTVQRDSRHSELVNLACKNALVQRGVGHLIVPDEVQTLRVPPWEEPGSPEGRLAEPTIAPAPEALRKAVRMLRRAKRPLFIVGHGSRHAMPAITKLAERLGCPVLTTFKAKGQIADSHPLGCGVLGRSGTPIASWFMNESELLVVFGASFSNHTGIEKKKPIIQVDFDRMMLGKFHPVTVPLWGEIGVSVSLLDEALAGEVASIDHRSEVAERWKLWRAEKERRLKDDRKRGVNSASVFAALTRTVPKDAILPVDVGNNTYSFGRYFECEAQAVLMSGYLGSIGFGLPAALGAWAATEEKDSPFSGRKVVSISGDGGLGQYLAELTTLVKYDMNVTHVVLNNDELGKISKEQRAGDWDVWQTSLVNPNFAKYAELCGALGLRVSNASALDDALSRALAHPGPSLVEVMTDPELV